MNELEFVERAFSYAVAAQKNMIYFILGIFCGMAIPMLILFGVEMILPIAILSVVILLANLLLR